MLLDLSTTSFCNNVWQCGHGRQNSTGTRATRQRTRFFMLEWRLETNSKNMKQTEANCKIDKFSSVREKSYIFLRTLFSTSFQLCKHPEVKQVHCWKKNTCRKKDLFGPQSPSEFRRRNLTQIWQLECLKNRLKLSEISHARKLFFMCFSFTWALSMIFWHRLKRPFRIRYEPLKLDRLQEARRKRQSFKGGIRMRNPCFW